MTNNGLRFHSGDLDNNERKEKLPFLSNEIVFLLLLSVRSVF